MAKFKPGDKVIISKDSKNIWIQGKKATVIRFLEEDNVPGSFYQWTYEVKLEDGDKCYVPQWEMVPAPYGRGACSTQRMNDRAMAARMSHSLLEKPTSRSVYSG